MAIWNSGQITSIYTGAIPNDSTGDPIRDAFIKVDENFGNISSYLGGGSGSGGLVSFLYANAETFSANVGTFTNLSSANLLVSNATITGNITADFIIANTELHSLGNLYAGNILPTTGGVYNLGSPSRPFANIYVQHTVSTTQINQSSDAGMLLIHANSAGNSDVGILGNVTDYDIDSGYTESIEFAFFGYQLESDAFVYKITPTNPLAGNSIVYNGIYGNTHFGSQLLSDTTASTTTNTGALIVTGGAGVGGNLNVGGTATVGGYQVITTNTPGIANFSGSTVANLVVVGVAPSTSPTTGALILSYGGAGVAGNINAGGNVVSTTGIVGPYYGTIQTSAQPNITSLGTITSLSAGYVGATSIGVTNLTVSGTLSMTGASLTGLNTLTVGSLTTTANTNSGNVIATGNVSAGYYLGNGILLTGIVTNGTFQTLSANVGAYEIATNANVGTIYTNLNTLTANLGLYQNTTNANVGTIYTNLNTLTANLGLYQNTTNANLGTATNNITTLFSNAATQATLITSLTNSTITVNGTTISLGGSGTVTAAAGTLTGSTLASGVTASSLTSVGTLTGLTIAGTTNTQTVQPSANVTYNLGSTTAWWNTIYGTAIHAQYADLAECYEADAEYEPGTVVVFGGLAEITVTTQFADTRVAGAVSTDPAYIMNGASGGTAIALRGKVPVKFVGPVNKGDLLVTCGARPGYAISVGTVNTYGQAVFAKSLTTDLDEGEKIITAVII